ncbi:TetR/AcrR family transcriptional regulator [Gluconobacter wancherniae]|uniref:TetR family transcriptional regulator n=1 Tax=Gluconobacter wancherniae NBRC 103581 TaxID=656744 RepID=A0A511AZR2_9PROT|nr:TetR/AcrR family transcriptional regulator [Gluconobacter wancherniae]MBF0853235.1 TetR/AcrR family transcriptional regulator [Gluconobacter wancherniae]GBD56036.1 TetR family transcriptional regulator [Gluconobacter wancherniae NBRC 103581]GBR63071.1 transcriptional regulator [Gluconobacter wancherniae NBRC 103581]GEK93062.1 TetR family transcriptional regulator [Gluconobacter wancherniae NBRC 103581]
MSTATRSSYHHGDLKAALIEASEEIIRAEGVEGFTLRKAAKSAGVSPGAPSHHFSGTKGLLTAIAIRTFEKLGAELNTLPSSGIPAQDLRTQGLGYVKFAALHPGLFRLICRVDLIDFKDPNLMQAAFEAMASYEHAAAAYFGYEPPDPQKRIFRPYMASAMATAHGLAHMVIEGRPALLFETPDPIGTFIETALPSILLATWPD